MEEKDKMGRQTDRTHQKDVFRLSLLLRCFVAMGILQDCFDAENRPSEATSGGKQIGDRSGEVLLYVLHDEIL